MDRAVTALYDIQMEDEMGREFVFLRYLLKPCSYFVAILRDEVHRVCAAQVCILNAISIFLCKGCNFSALKSVRCV